MAQRKKPKQGYDDEVTGISEEAAKFKAKGGGFDVISRFMKAAYNKFFASDKMALIPRKRKAMEKKVQKRLKGEDDHQGFSEN